MRLLFSLLLLSFSTVLQSQSLKFDENFDDAESTMDLLNNFQFSRNIQIDTVFREEYGRSIALKGTTKILLTRSFSHDVGRLEMKLYQRGSEAWSLNCYVPKGADFNMNNPNDWKLKASVDRVYTDPEGFSINSFLINHLGNAAGILIEIVSTSDTNTDMLFLDDLKVYGITTGDAQRIQQEEAFKKQLADQRKLLDNISQANSNEVKEIIDEFEANFECSARYLLMANAKAIKIGQLSDIATVSSQYNQLNNPINFNSYKNLKATLYSELDELEQADFKVKVENKITGFFEKMKTPLQLIGAGVDLLTGGRLNSAIDNFTRLITDNFNKDRLVAKYGNKKSVEIYEKGLKLYKNSTGFFRIIQEQNTISLKLTRELAVVSVKSQDVQTEISDVARQLFESMDIEFSDNSFRQWTNNPDYQSQLFDDIENRFEEMRNSDLKRVGTILDLQEIDQKISQTTRIESLYNELSNLMLAYMEEIETNLVRPCPYREVSPEDCTTYETSSNEILTTLRRLMTTFRENDLILTHNCS